MKTYISAIIFAICTLTAVAQTRSLFDSDWQFTLCSDSLCPAFPDATVNWRQVTLPHDWSIEGGFNKENPSGGDGGYLPCGTGWYRKVFRITKADKEKRLWLYFEGVYMNSAVYVNGKLVGGHPYGFSSFFVDITDFVSYDTQNTVAVRVDNSLQKNCRWYTGSGIYRHVWLMKEKESNRQEPWEPFVRMEKIFGISDDGVKADSAIVRISRSGQSDELRSFRDVRLWSPEHPELYDIDVDGRNIEFGFRTIEYSAEKGFLLNGQPVKFNGGCIHHDNGMLGTAAYDKAEWRKAQLMKEAGFNSVRTSHNAPSPEFLRACDHIGLMVIDEAFDGWRDAKNTHDYHTLIDEWWQKDIDALVLRDRNHPSVICWSNGNEVIERKKLEVVTTSKKMADRMRELDPTRPVTQALASWDSDWEIYDPLAATLDITGYNYMIHKAESDHERVPKRVMWQTESYPRDAFKNWAKVVDNQYILGDFVWTAIDYIGESSIGTWHYDGENRGEHWQGEHYPWHGAYCGDIDLTGWRKPISYYREILWDVDKKNPLYMAVKEPQGFYGKLSETSWSVWPTWESWNWKGHEGKPIEVEIYSRYPKVRLYLNGKVVGEKPTTRAEEFKATFSINYAPGALRCVALNSDGSEIAESESILKTSAEKASQLRLTPTSQTLKADGQDIVWVTVELLDNKGVLVPDATDELQFSVSGPAQILATANANLKDETPYPSHIRKAWKGRAIVALRSTERAGKVVLSVKAKGFGKRISLIQQ
ncbi:MAG: DUF4982 domain-containing protein [Bacteroidaceae bacterium]|nr:DUF4982 domain-containing protein [Bacteroidaceae bacterium]